MIQKKKTTRAQESSSAIERLYVTMRHLFNRGFYKPAGVSGQGLKEALLLLRPEIYGSIAEERTELSGLIYVLERLPEGIEECYFINLIADEGYRKSHFQPIIPPKRRRNCYRIGPEQINIEITRGRSDIYDILTHLTFLFIESHKIANKVLDEHKKPIRDWEKITHFVTQSDLSKEETELSLTYVSNVLMRPFDEVFALHQELSSEKKPNRLLHLVYWMGKIALDELLTQHKRVITFSRILREEIGHHIYGEIWANNIKKTLLHKKLLHRPLHIISANLHSVMNCLYARAALGNEVKNLSDLAIYEKLSTTEGKIWQEKIQKYAAAYGMYSLLDTSGTNIDTQIFDTAKIDFSATPYACNQAEKPILFVMDYAFGEQAFETIDELLKPYKTESGKTFLQVESVSIMGKAGILAGNKGDIMIPTAHIFEGTADNYPFDNELSKTDFQNCGLGVYEGTMVSVLGTSLQNKDILNFFHKSTWNVIGLEMEGAHYQKAIQSASKIRKSINKNVKVRYAYYASDNPLETGSTLASGALGVVGVKPTYLITEKILQQILQKP